MLLLWQRIHLGLLCRYATLGIILHVVKQVQRGATGSKAAALLAAVPRQAAPGVTGGGDWLSGVSSFAFQVPTFASRQTAVWVR